MKANLPTAIGRIIFALVASAMLSGWVSTSARAASGTTLSEVASVGRIAAFVRPIVWLDDQRPPSNDDTAALADAMRVWLTRGDDPGAQAMELFVSTYTNSAWLPSLESQLGKYYRERGRYTPALQHWAAAWAATKDATDGPAKEVADFTLAFYTRLLASLGRIETLDDIFAETSTRVLDQGPLSQIYMGTMEGWAQMHRQPGHSYRCGAFALNEVANALRGNNYDRSAFNAPSPASGFSVADLMGMQNKINLGLVPALRLAGDQLVVPSVIHWQQAHYAAVVEQRGNLYKVVDPTVGHSQWLTGETINSEASGVFLVPGTLMPQTNWRLLSANETLTIFGRGNPQMQHDGDDCDCPDDDGDPGMPIWHVHEPFVSLWLTDSPMGYQPALGHWISFRLAYKEHDVDSNLDPDVYSLGSSWNSSLILSHVYSIMDYRYGAIDATVYFPGGGNDHFNFNNGVATSYFNNDSLQAFTDGSNHVTGFQLTRPDGSSYTYSFFRTQADGSWAEVYLTQFTDTHGYATTYNYATYDPNSMAVRLNSITDPDGHSVTFSYNAGVSGHTNLISQVTDPFSRSATLQYNTNALITNITDVANLSSRIAYDGNGWPSSLTTPYGTTYFTITSSTNDYIDVNGGIDRSVLVTEPNGSHQLYVYRGYSPQLPFSYDSSLVPVTPLSTFNNIQMYLNNTFYWNRLQYASLSSTNMNSFSNSDYLKARMRNWLFFYGSDSWPDPTLNMEQAPSPDGTTAGQMTWLDYDGESANTNTRGTQIMPAEIAVVLPDGITTSYKAYSRNSFGLPTEISGTYSKADGSIGTRSNTLVYYSNGLDLQYELGPNGELLRGYSYNNYHQVLTHTNAMYEVTTNGYDATSRLLTWVHHPNGLATTNTYNSDNRLSLMVDKPIDKTNSFTYYTAGMVYSHTDEHGLTVTNYWDSLQRPIGVLYPDATTSSNVYTYLDMTASKDRMTNWTYYGYNAIRQKIAETNANNVITRYGYCDCGSLKYITNGFGTAAQEATSFGYDYQGNRTFVFYPDGTTVTNWYDSLRRPIATADGIGTRWLGYNNQGLLIGITNAAGVEKSVLFDIEDREYSNTDANGVTVTNTYDNLGRLLTRTYPDIGVEKFGYSPRGLTAYTNQLNLATYYTYDEGSRKTAETNANNEVIKYTYNAASDLLTLKDGKSQVTTWNYDQYGRVTNKLDQASVEILRYKYDADSRLTNRWSKAKGDTFYTYDNLGNLTFVNYPTSPDITLQYNALNRLTNMVDAAGTSKYTYYAGGLLATEDGPWASDTVTYTYNNRLRASLSLQQPTGSWTNGYTWDAAHRLSTETSPAGIFTYTYQSPGKLVKKLGLPNTSYITNTFDNVGRLSGTYLDNSSNTVLDKSEYLYNTNSQRIRLTRTDGSYYTNTYDNIGQLKWADSTVNTEDRGYLYDAAWNLSQRTNNGAVTTFYVDAKNQLTGTAGSFTYDDNGNLTASNGTYFTYGYDDENRLTNWTSANTAKTDFTYDGLGRLRKRIEYTYNGGWQVSGETRYIYDSMRVIQERDGANAPTVSYTRGIDLRGTFEGAGGISGLLARSHGYSSATWAGHNFYHADGGGNVTMLIDNAGTPNVTATYRYDPFGNSISATGTNAANNVYRFSSKEIHVNSGMYYFGYRWYDPNLQRWLNRDPIGELGFQIARHNGTHQGLRNVRSFSRTLMLMSEPNVYDVVFNDPENRVDPHGDMCPTIVEIITVALIAGLLIMTIPSNHPPHILPPPAPPVLSTLPPAPGAPLPPGEPPPPWWRGGEWDPQGPGDDPSDPDPEPYPWGIGPIPPQEGGGFGEGID